MQAKSIIEVEESVQGVLEALPSILRSSPTTPLTQQISEAAKILSPPGYRPVVELQENGRRKRRTASAENWSPETGEILISFSRDDSIHRQSAVAPAAPDKGTSMPPARTSEASASVRPALESPVEELCRALEQVERQGLAFVALKRFRDTVLPATQYAWASDPDQRQAVLASAIEKGLIVTSRVPNPRSAFPTTAIRLNRMPIRSQAEGQRYAPVRIQGEPLSTTILRDRGAH